MTERNPPGSGVEAEPVERHLQVTRTARYWTLGDEEGAREVWFVLHGYRQLARRFLRRFEPISEPGRLIVAPEALSRFYTGQERGRHGQAAVVGGSWMTREDRLNEIRDYVAYLDGLADVVLGGAESVTVLGFSQGTATAARWVSLGSIRAARLILWAGYLPHDQDVRQASRVFSDTDLILVRGEADPGLDDARAADERRLLEEAGSSYRVVSYPGGHEIDTATLRALASA